MCESTREDEGHRLENEYYLRFCTAMQSAPRHVSLFSSPNVTEEERRTFVQWLRDADNLDSPLSLQVRYAFSIPCNEALDVLQRLTHVQRWISCGSGTGYWEWLMQKRGLVVLPFDQNTVYPQGMRFIDIDTADSTFVKEQSRVTDGLFIAWPDDSEESTFGVECLQSFKGNIVAHVGELLGETLSANPWGQSTSKAFQLLLTEDFRLIKRILLPRWPHQMDTLTIWQRVSPPIECGDAHFVGFL
eukprot:m.188940 g.188940  ORF g.188940 m.188940 type:complete len:245 (+) comp16735_c0_seq1:224-958(+)